MTDDELEGLFDSLRQENLAAHEETRRYLGVTAEAIRHEVRLVAKAVAQLDAKVGREVERLDTTMDRGFAETQAAIRFSHAELDRRLRAVEAKTPGCST
ncbi:MAG TPA: hypothetical protein VMT00_14120 [Thermoanaerobaculia bacterium]|nr:hypothetical protein [Thermoanaerobaculia bacterium]